MPLSLYALYSLPSVSLSLFCSLFSILSPMGSLSMGVVSMAMGPYMGWYMGYDTISMTYW